MAILGHRYAMVMLTLAVGVGCIATYAAEKPGPASPIVCQTLQGHTREVLAVAFELENGFLASSDAHGDALFWNIAAMKPVRKAERFSFTSGVVFDRGANRFLCFDCQHLVQFTGEFIQKKPMPQTKASERAERAAHYVTGESPYGEVPIHWEGAALACNREGDYLALGYIRTGKSLIRTYQVDRPPPMLLIKALKDRRSVPVDDLVLSFLDSNPIEAMEFLPDGRKLAIAGRHSNGGGYAALIDAYDTKGVFRQKPALFDRPITSLAAGSEQLVVGFGVRSDGKQGGRANVAVLNLSDLSIRKTMVAGAGGVSSVALAEKSKRLFVAGQESQIYVFSTDDLRELNPLKGHTDVVRTVRVSPDGKLLASGSDDKTIKLWELEK
jgi:WD40 repeat protein